MHKFDEVTLNGGAKGERMIKIFPMSECDRIEMNRMYTACIFIPVQILCLQGIPDTVLQQAELDDTCWHLMGPYPS